MLQRTEMRHGSENRGAPLGARWEADGWHLLLRLSGSGGPLVVFLPRAGVIGLDFLKMHDQVSAVTASVLCDRAGIGLERDV